jgi:hypothetical protein
MGQEQFVDFDVSQAETSVCVVMGAGKDERRMPPGSLSRPALCPPGTIAA